MSATKSIVLITGANGGIGFEVARQLLHDANKHVIAGSRSLEKGEAAVKQLQDLGLPGSIEAIQMEVTDQDSIKKAAAKVEADHGRVDAIINNAGIAAMPPQDSTYDKMMKAFTVNAVGPVLIVENFGPLLKKSKTTPRIVNVSSIVSSITERLNPASRTYTQEAVHYRTSKAALNMVSACQAYEFGQFGGKVFVYDPGFTVSNLSPFNTEENGARSTADSAKPIVVLVNGERDAEHGCFVDSVGQVPW